MVLSETNLLRFSRRDAAAPSGHTFLLLVRVDAVLDEDPALIVQQRLVGVVLELRKKRWPMC